MNNRDSWRYESNRLNTQAVDNQDLVEILTRSASAMAEANNSLEDTIALGTAITTVTRDSAKAGNMLKTSETVFMYRNVHSENI